MESTQTDPTRAARRRSNSPARTLLAASLIAAAGLPTSLALAQQNAAAPAAAPSAAPAPTPAPTPTPAPAAAAPVATPPGSPTPETAKIQFNFKDAPFDQVIDFFAREAGLPIIFETPAPAGTMTFVGAGTYAFDEALTILNLNLQRFNVHLRRQGQFLYLASIQDSARKASQVEHNTVDPGIPPDQIITLTIPLSNAKAETVAEQIKPLVGPFGSASAVPQQNMVIIVEAAAQARRIREIVQSIDAVKPIDSAFRLFPLQYAQCEPVLNALRGLMGERQKTVIVDKDGQQRTIQDQNLAGLNLAADQRTNSIVAVGPEARIRTVEEMIKLLDVPEGMAGDSEIQMLTFTLRTLTPDAAVAQVSQLFATLPPKGRPQVLALNPAGKVTIIGHKTQVAQARQLLGEIDPGAADSKVAAVESRTVVIRPRFALPPSIEAIATRMLTPRQLSVVKWAPSPDQKGVIVTGPDADVAAFENLVAAVDVPAQTDKDVRVIKLTGGAAENPAAVLAKAQELDKATGKTETDPVVASLDIPSKSVTVVGTAAGLARFQGILAQVQSTSVTVEARTIAVSVLKPSEIAPRLVSVFKAIRLGDQGKEPEVEPLDELKRLVVRAEPGQLAVIEQLVRNLDTVQPAERPPLRILQLRNTDAGNLAQVLQSSFDQRPGEQRIAQPVSIQADLATNTLIVSAAESVYPEIEAIVSKLNESQQLTGTEREIRIFPLKVARAEELAQTIDQMYPEPPVPLDPRTRQPRYDLKQPREIVVRADRATNSLIVDAPNKRLAGFEQIVRSLDQQKLVENLEVRTYKIKNADPNAVAAALRDLAAKGALTATAPGAASTVPFSVSIEPTSRALILSGPKQAFDPAEKLITELDAKPELPSTDLKLFPLKQARADRLQPIVQRLLAARLRESQAAAGRNPADEAKLLEVSSDAASNTLIVSAPRELIAIAEGVITTLDQQSVNSAVEVRVFRLTKGQAATISAALTSSVNAQNAPGETPATVTPEPGSNSLVIVGTTAQLARAAKLIEQMDVSIDPEGLGVRSIALKHARAESLAPVVQTVLTRESALDKLPEWAKVQAIARSGPSGGEPAAVKVAADARTNAIVVSGPKAMLDLAEQIVSTLDTDAAGKTQTDTVRIITLQNADASELAQNLQAVFQDQKAVEAPPVIRVDRSSNSLVIRGTDSQMAQVETIAGKLDAATLNTSRQLRTIPVDRSKVDAELLARTLKRLLDQQPGSKVEIVPAEELIRRANPDAKPADPNAGDRGQPKKSGNAFPVSPPIFTPVGSPLRAAVMASVLAWEPEPRKAAAAKSEPVDNDVTIGVDPATNSLLILGSPRATDRIAAIAAQLQQNLPSEPTAIRIVPLPASADVGTVAQLMNQMVAQIGRANPQNPSGFSGPVSIATDPAGSSLIIAANATDFAVVGELLGSVLSLSTTQSLTVKVYPLTSVSASRAKQALADFVSPQPVGYQARRVRGLDLTVEAAPGEKPLRATIDPSLVRITADPMGTSLIVAAPAETMPLIDRFVGLIDQSPTDKRLAIRRYPLKNAQANELVGTLQQLFDAQRQGPAAGEITAARFIADARSNALLVTASEPQHADVLRLLETADASTERNDLALAIIPLQQASPSTVRSIVDSVIIGKDTGKRERIRLSADDASNLFVVRAPKEDIEQIKQIIAQVDTSAAGGLPVRSIKLERADANAVAAALTRFFTERANVSTTPGRRAANRVAVIGDKRSGTLVVAASDEDYEQVQTLAKTFDTPADAQSLQFKVIALKNARVADLESTLRALTDTLMWERMNTPGAQRGDGERFIIETNQRTNALVLMGTGDAIATAERVIATLDQAPSEKTQIVVRAVAIGNADLPAVKSVLEKAMVTPGWRPFRGQDPDAVTVEIDKLGRRLVLVGKADRVAQAEAYIKDLDASAARPGQVLESVVLANAKADRAAQTLRQFFQQRAQAQGLPADSVSIIGSPDGNVLILAADPDTLKSLKELVTQIDTPDQGAARKIEIFVMKNIGVQEAAASLRAMFPAGNSRANEQLIVTPQPSTTSIIVSAPEALLDQVHALISQLDAPPTTEQANIATVTLSSAKAAEVATALKAALPQNVKVVVTPVARSNSILLTGSAEAIAIASEQIKKIDTEPVKSLLVFKRIKLANAPAEDVFFNLRSLLRSRNQGPDQAGIALDYSASDNTLLVSASTDQVEEVAKIVAELDVAPNSTRSTEFVKLQFADAAQISKALDLFYGRYAPEAATPGARSVTILPDAASNSLVISADQKEWEGLKILLAKLDTKEYDTSRQLQVIPLRSADATSVARAINEGLRAPLEEQVRQTRARQQQNQRIRPGDNQPAPAILLGGDGVPTISAEPQTNALIVFAGRRDMERIEAIVKQLDVPGFANMPAPSIIPLKSGKATQIAATLREMFIGRLPGGQQAGPRAVAIIGDDAAGALIVRADESQMAQIKALAESLTQSGENARLMPQVVRLKNVPAARLRATLLATFQPMATQMGETIAVEVDRGTNSLVIAASPRIYEQMAKVIAELDDRGLGALQAGQPGASIIGQSVTVIDITNNDPDQVKRTLEDMGLNKAQPADRPGVVAEPVTIVTLSSRRAIAVLANPADGQAVAELVRAIDAAPIEAEQKIQVIPLKLATAATLVKTLDSMISPTEGLKGPNAVTTGPARALAEQVRRLSIARNGLDSSKLELDLAKPIRLIADVDTNSIVIASTPGNVVALSEVIAGLDTLPIGEAVVVRIFPLDNASAVRTKAVIDQLFTQGEQLRRIPGTRRQGLPSTATGKALAGEVAVAVDDRTNALIVAGREEAIALVEVLVKDLDSDRASNWVEPAVVQLKFADATTIAEKLREVLVKGLATTPEAMGLQKQFGRLRMLHSGSVATFHPADPALDQGKAEATKVEPGKPGAPPVAAAPANPNVIAADLFAPVTGLVITPEETLNALIVVGTPANIAVVKELVSLLDVEAASAQNTVHVYPLKFAAAERVASIVQDLFRQRERAGPTRPEDKLVLSADTRTNSLLISTSNRSFAIIEGLLKQIDAEEANYSVGLHILPVTGATVTQLAPKIERLMRERLEAATRSGAVRNPLDAFSIEAEPINNLLIIAASDENLGVIKELVSALSKDANLLNSQQRTEMIQLTQGTPADVAVQIKSLYLDKQNATRGNNAVNVVPNERLNAIIVTGTETDINEIRSLVTRLETAQIQAVREVRRIELKSANALEVVNLVENVLAGRPLGGRAVAGKQATKIRFLKDQVAGDIKNTTGRTATEADIDGFIREQVTLTPDIRTNSVMVAAPPQMLKLIDEFVSDIDNSNAGLRKIETFQLKNADARAMAELLRDVFNLRQQGSSYVLVPAKGPDDAAAADGASPAPAGPSATPAPSSQLAGTTVTAVPDERQQLSIAIDARTNTLLVSGTKEYLDLVRKVVTDLDSVEASDRERVVYHLRNAKAKEIEATLASYFKGESTLERSTLGPQLSGSLVRQLEREVTIVGDDKSNKLVISTSPRYMDMLLKIVQELDSAPPQVMIEVLLAEVTIDASDEWGMDASIGPFGGDAYKVSSSASSTGKVETGIGVPNLSVASADFGLLIRALQAQGKLEILSNPQVMVNNNNKAKIQVGENVAIVTNVELTPQGSTRSSVTRKDVGIILNVTPAISNDGFVRMEINPEISQVTAKTTQITADFQAPVINQRTVDTIVTVKDGQSVVIGGLIQSNEENRKTKVPLLGDIPGIGAAFQTMKKTAVKTELLVILTPRIIPGSQGGGYVEAADRVDAHAIDRLEDSSRIRNYLDDLKTRDSDINRRDNAEPANPAHYMNPERQNGPAKANPDAKPMNPPPENPAPAGSGGSAPASNPGNVPSQPPTQPPVLPPEREPEIPTPPVRSTSARPVDPPPAVTRINTKR